MATVQDFISTYLTLQNLEQTKEQLRLQQIRDRSGALNILSNVLGNVTDPAARQQIARSVAGSLGLSPDSVDELARQQTPTNAAVMTSGFQRGLSSLGEAEQQNLERTLATRQMSGMTPTGLRLEEQTGQMLGSGLDQLGQEPGIDRLMAIRQSLGTTGTGLAVDQQGMELGGQELQEAAGIGLGTRANAGQVLGATTQAAGIRASQQNALLDYQGRLDQIRASQGPEAADAFKLSAKDLSDDIISITGQLREGGMGGAGEDFLQRNLASRVVSLLNHPLNPYPDLYPGNPKPGETQQEHFRRAAAEATARITGQRMSNDKTFWEAILPGGR